MINRRKEEQRKWGSHLKRAMLQSCIYGMVLKLTCFDSIPPILWISLLRNQVCSKVIDLAERLEPLLTQGRTYHMDM